MTETGEAAAPWLCMKNAANVNVYDMQVIWCCTVGVGDIWRSAVYRTNQ